MEESLLALDGLALLLRLLTPEKRLLLQFALQREVDRFCRMELLQLIRIEEQPPKEE